MIDRPYGQRLDYQMQTPTTQVWLRLFQEGKLNEAQSAFWREKPSQELYDLENDPDQVRNLAASPGHAAERERLAGALRRQLLTIRDLGFLPEGEMHRRAAAMTPCPGPTARALPGRAGAGSGGVGLRPSAWDEAATERLRRLLRDPDSAVRAWAAMGLRARGEPGRAVRPRRLRAALRDASAPVRIYAAEALGRFGEEADREPVVELLLASASIADNDFFEVLLALNALDYLDAEVLAAPSARPGGIGCSHCRGTRRSRSPVQELRAATARGDRSRPAGSLMLGTQPAHLGRDWAGHGSLGRFLAMSFVSSQQESDVVPDKVAEEAGLMVLQILRVGKVGAVSNPPAGRRREVSV